MTDSPAVARLCPRCGQRFCPVTQPRCDSCAPTAPKRAPKPPDLDVALASGQPLDETLLEGLP